MAKRAKAKGGGSARGERAPAAKRAGAPKARAIWRGGSAAAALVRLGLNELEAQVYGYLVEQGPATGYQAAKELGRAVANTYKALYSLEEKGAVLVEDGESRRCRAVAPRELLARLERDFRERHAAAAKALAGAPRPAEDAGVYRLTTASQVMERARAMLSRAERNVAVEAFPRPCAELADDLERAVARGVRVVAVAYEPASIAGVPAALHPSRDLILAAWPGDLLYLAVDAREHLHAILERERDAVVQAVWTESTLLACQAHLAGVNNAVLCDLMGALERGVDRAGLEAELARNDPHRLRETLGFADLRALAAPG